jgi:hypothetical protein
MERLLSIGSYGPNARYAYAKFLDRPFDDLAD